MDENIFLNQLLEKRKQRGTTIEKLQILLAEEALELQKINAEIAGLEGNPDAKFNWIEPALICIRSSDEFLQTTEILQRLFANNPTQLLFEKTRRNHLVSLSVALSVLYNSGRIGKVILEGEKGHFYGLPQWFARNGKILKEYATKLQLRLDGRKGVVQEIG